MSRIFLVLLSLLLGAAPLAAQRVADLRTGAVHQAVHQHDDVRSSAAASSGWAEMPTWARHAVIGTVIGAFGGWALSGLPCENAPSNCPSTAGSVLAGAAVGAVIGALWSVRRA